MLGESVALGGRGIFETSFKEIAEKIHAAGGLVYMDGANMNAQVREQTAK